jgi:hypothetical protein
MVSIKGTHTLVTQLHHADWLHTLHTPHQLHRSLHLVRPHMHLATTIESCNLLVMSPTTVQHLCHWHRALEFSPSLASLD